MKYGLKTSKDKLKADNYKTVNLTIILASQRIEPINYGLNQNNQNHNSLNIETATQHLPNKSQEKNSLTKNSKCWQKNSKDKKIKWKHKSISYSIFRQKKAEQFLIMKSNFNNHNIQSPISTKNSKCLLIILLLSKIIYPL